jgi:hypothetical protein
MKILFVGDIMPGGVLPYQDNFIDSKLLNYLDSFDLRVGTLECAIGTNIPYDSKKMDSTMGIVYARDTDLERVILMGINLVTLANNHIGDLGFEGIKNTIKRLDDAGIQYCGAGLNIYEARRPVVIEDGNEKIAIIGCMLDYYRPIMFYRATETDAGVYQVDIKTLLNYIRELKQTFSKVVIMPHWCEEHKYLPPVIFREYAYKMIASGADCIIGSHPHIPNPVITYHSKKIYFSLGNFLFPDKCMQVPRPTYYPTDMEFRELKKVWTYPYRINEPVIAVWKGRNRIGMVVELDTNKKFSTRYKLVCLTSENVLKKYKSISYCLHLFFGALLLKLPYYRFIRRIYYSKWNLIRRFFDKLELLSIRVNLFE